MSDFLIRSAEPGDLDDLFVLSRRLDSYNLPADRPRLKKILADSVDSFAGRLKSPQDGRYLFVLETAGHVVGCSLIVAKHGTPGKPHLYMTCFTEKFTSRTLNKTVEHQSLRLGATEDGPTEVGGLVLLPRYRGRPEKLGAWLSYVRLLYVAAHMDRFQTYLLAEYLPTFLKGRTSPFWDYLGAKFTGLSYKEADRLSIDNKEFILSLFPRGTIYQDYLPAEVVKYLGQVGEESKPAARLLEKVGFQYLHQIEPFDGGPYYGTLTRQVSLIQAAREVQCHTVHTALAGKPHLMLAESAKGGVRAVVAPAVSQGVHASLSVDMARSLGLSRGDWFWSVPFPS
jgi:arginine N-succinyltransferase